MAQVTNKDRVERKANAAAARAKLNGAMLKAKANAAIARTNIQSRQP